VLADFLSLFQLYRFAFTPDGFECTWEWFAFTRDEGKGGFLGDFGEKALENYSCNRFFNPDTFI
jgi:hypothetical protein